ncbi:MAG TPA: hypothetical protein EYH54_01585 [Nautiliaceae bacterium]|nr:hypothetical protein [Nautiliaceae bacterium]
MRFLKKLIKINLAELNKYNIYSFLLYDEDIINYFWRESKKINKILTFVIAGIISYSYYTQSFSYLLLIPMLIIYYLPWYKSSIVKYTITNEWKGLNDKLNKNFYGIALTLYQISSPKIPASILFKEAYKLPDLEREIKIFLKYINFQLEKGVPINETLYKLMNIFKGNKLEKFITDLLLSIEEGTTYNFLKSTVYEEAEKAKNQVKGYTSILKAMVTMIIALTIMLNIVLFVILSYTYGQISSLEKKFGATATSLTFDVGTVIPQFPVKEILLFEAFLLFPAIAFGLYAFARFKKPLGI